MSTTDSRMTEAMATAATTSPTDLPPPGLGPITHVALTVRDLSVSVPWYERLVGSGPVLDEDTGPFHHVVFAVGGTLLGLHLFPGETVADEFDPRRPGLDHVAFLSPDRATLDAWRDRLTGLGIATGEVVDAHYGSGLAFKDPDGLALEIFAAAG
jgi:glyoxylase I family protein